MVAVKPDKKHIFGDIKSCAMDFARQCIPDTLRTNREMGAYIFARRDRRTKEITGYFYADVFRGVHKHCIWGAFFYGAVHWGYRNAKRIAFIHTHPKCKCHIPDRFSKGDKLVRRWCAPGIRYCYLCAPTTSAKPAPDDPRLLRWNYETSAVDSDIPVIY